MRDQTFSLDVIQIQSPCSASWDAMDGDEVRRFCEECQLHVHNLSEMRRRDAEALVSQAFLSGHGFDGKNSGGGARVCVQMQRGADGRVITREDRRWTRKLRRRAAYVSGRLLVGLASAAVVLLGSTGVLASREAEWMQKFERWRPTWFPALHQSPRVAGGLQGAPPVPGMIAVPQALPGEELRLGEMMPIQGDIALPAPPPPPEGEPAGEQEPPHAS